MGPFGRVVIVIYIFSASLCYLRKFFVNKMANAKSAADTTCGGAKSRSARSTLQTIQKRTKADGGPSDRQYKIYARPIISEDSDTEPKVLEAADRQHAMYSEGYPGRPYQGAARYIRKGGCRQHRRTPSCRRRMRAERGLGELLKVESDRYRGDHEEAKRPQIHVVSVSRIPNAV